MGNANDRCPTTLDSDKGTNLPQNIFEVIDLDLMFQQNNPLSDFFSGGLPESAVMLPYQRSNNNNCAEMKKNLRKKFKNNAYKILKM